MSSKFFKCPFCELKYIQKPSLYSHMEKEHESQLNGLSPAQIYFNYKNKKTGGKCIMCGKPTKFNEASERYDRLCSPECKEAYREMFKKRMKDKYGTEHLLDDPEQQKKMLANRKISGTYVWSKDKKYKFTYTGTYEKDFLEFMDIFLNWSPNDIIMPAPQVFEYYYQNKKHFYIPDVFIPSLNLIIEIKSSTNKHYRERDLVQEKIKDKILEKSPYNYIKILDKEYDNFFKTVNAIKNKF